MVKHSALQVDALWGTTPSSARRGYKAYWANWARVEENTFSLVRVVVPRSPDRAPRSFHFVFKGPSGLTALTLTATKWAGVWTLAETAPDVRVKGSSWIKGFMNGRFSVHHEDERAKLYSLLARVYKDEPLDVFERHLALNILVDDLWEFCTWDTEGAFRGRGR